MGRVENSMGGIASNIPTAAAVAVAMPAPDVESQWRPEPTAPHFESQSMQEPTAPHFESQSMQEHTQQVTASTVEFEDDRAGMGLGITLFILILLGFLALIIGSIIVLPHTADVYYDDIYYNDDYLAAVGYSWFLGILAYVCFIVALVIASVLTCGCCCAGKYKLKHHVKKRATATLVTMCLVLIFNTLFLVFMTVSRSGFVAIFAIESVLLFMAVIFSGLFTWGRGRGAPHAYEG